MRLVELKSKPELNGTLATILQWHDESCRWAVECDGTRMGLRARAANLEDAEGEVQALSCARFMSGAGHVSHAGEVKDAHLRMR